MTTKMYFGTASFDPTSYLTTVPDDIDSFTQKATLVGDDIVVIDDSAASYAKKKVKLSTINSTKFGGFSQVESNDSWISTTSSTYQDALTLTSSTDMPVGDYCLFWTAWMYSSHTTNMEVFVCTNFVTDSIPTETVHQVRLDGTTMDCWFFQGISFKNYTSAATRTYKLQYRAQASTGTAYIGFKRMCLFQRS